MSKILVSVKRVVDYAVKIRVKGDGSGVDIANVKMSMNPFDEIAVEEAVQHKEKGAVDEVVVVSIGPDKAQDILRTALAMGADRALLVKTDEKVEPLDVARILQRIVADEAPMAVMMGKQAIDDDCNQTGQMLAALLGWGQATFASEVQLKDQTAEVTQEVDGGLRTIEVPLPAIITADLRLNTPRYASLPNIMKAKKKPLDVKSVEELGIELNPRLKVLNVEAPPQRAAGTRVSNVAELVDKLQNEAGVL